MRQTPTRPWKVAVMAERRKAAEERQKRYASIPFSEKMKNAGAKEREKLLDKQSQVAQSAVRRSVKPEDAGSKPALAEKKKDK